MKTNFLNKLKQGLFLLIAVLGTFINYAQSTQTIGGSKTPNTGGLLNIGGKQVPPITPFANSSITSHLVTRVFEIGGNPGQERRNLAIGRNQVPSRRFCKLCVGLTSEIGGQGTTRTYTDIGGNQAPPPRRISSLYANKEIGGRGTSSGTGQIYSSNVVATLDTVKVPIRGKDSSGGLGKYSSAVGFKNGIDHNSIFEIGGTGGRGTDSSTGQKNYSIVVVMLSNSKLDIGGRSTGGDYTISDIGGNRVPTTSLLEIGGNQGPPRQVNEINSSQVSVIDFEIGGHGSVPPRSVFEVTPITVPIEGNSTPRS